MPGNLQTENIVSDPPPPIIVMSLTNPPPSTHRQQAKIWSRVPKGGPIHRLTGRLSVGRKKNSNSKLLVEELVWRLPEPLESKNLCVAESENRFANQSVFGRDSWELQLWEEGSCWLRLGTVRVPRGRATFVVRSRYQATATEDILHTCSSYSEFWSV
jgi:hypothetical protein